MPRNMQALQRSCFRDYFVEVAELGADEHKDAFRVDERPHDVLRPLTPRERDLFATTVPEGVV